MGLQSKTSKAVAGLIKKLKNTPARPGVSKIQGVGLIAVRNIKKGEKLYDEEGAGPRQDIAGIKYHQIDMEVVDEIQGNPRTCGVGSMVEAYLGSSTNDKGKEVIFLPATGFDRMHPLWFANMSEKKQNIKYLDPDEYNGGGVVALRNIKKGQELLLNYKDLGEEFGEDCKEQGHRDDKEWVRAQQQYDESRRQAVAAQRKFAKAEKLMEKATDKAVKRKEKYGFLK